MEDIIFCREKPMAHTTYIFSAGPVAPDQKSIVVTACRAFSMISGGFLMLSNFGSSQGLDPGLMALLGCLLGIFVAIAIELSIRRVDR